MRLAGPGGPAAAAAVDQAEAALATARAALERAQLDLAHARPGPDGGRIRETLVNLGRVVAQGTSLARVFATDAVAVRRPVSLADRLPKTETGKIQRFLLWPREGGNGAMG